MINILIDLDSLIGILDRVEQLEERNEWQRTTIEQQQKQLDDARRVLGAPWVFGPGTDAPTTAVDGVFDLGDVNDYRERGCNCKVCVAQRARHAGTIPALTSTDAKDSGATRR